MIKIGEKYETKKYGIVEVIGYEGANKVKIKFIDTSFERYASASKIRSGDVKDVTKPSIFGVGFIGDGRFSYNNEAYKRWYQMLRRCYCPYFLNRNKSYRDVVVCDSWHNFQNFAEWFNKTDHIGMELDKDLGSKGGKIYSPDTCMMLSIEDNRSISNNGDIRVFTIENDGMTVTGRNLHKVSTMLGLSSGNLCKLINGKINKHKGWRVIDVKALQNV